MTVPALSGGCKALKRAMSSQCSELGETQMRVPVDMPGTHIECVTVWCASYYAMQNQLNQI